MKKSLFLLLVLLLAGACQRGEIFKIEEVRFEKSQGECKGESSPCAKVELSYPVLSGGSAAGRERLNGEIRAFALRQIDEAVAKDAAAYATAFFAEYQKFGREFPKAPQSWWENRQVKVLLNTPQVFSLSSEWEGYMGG
ncbi:MAG TPA: DUF4163 domain-containing protein, partial [bacterium]|nr:DUF4163 domain-containing protein [bacterium]